MGEWPVSQVGLMNPKMRRVLLIRGGGSRPNTVVTWMAIIRFMHGGGGTPLSAVRPCGMDITPRKALDMYGSLYLTISYLLRAE